MGVGIFVDSSLFLVCESSLKCVFLGIVKKVNVNIKTHRHRDMNFTPTKCCEAERNVTSTIICGWRVHVCKCVLSVGLVISAQTFETVGIGSKLVITSGMVDKSAVCQFSLEFFHSPLSN